jgi:hypothetical protein
VSTLHDAVQTPPMQAPLRQLPAFVHASPVGRPQALSEKQISLRHTPALPIVQGSPLISPQRLSIESQIATRHSTSLAHASPFCVQNEGALQMPLLQYCEQHSPLPPHGLPDVLHAALRGAHLPAVHVPLQHSPLSVHAALSATHWFAEQLPLMHANVQQSGPI